jgi:exodeoxyribonuclease X
MSRIRVVDFETTGFEPPEGVVIEVGLSDYDTESGQITNPVSWLCGADTIPPENRAVHHIRLSEIKGCAPFSAESLAQGLREECQAVAAHNMQFEQQWMGDHGVRTICTYKAALRVWPEAPSHANAALCYWLEDQGLVTLNHDLCQPTHRAGPDAYITAHILKALFAAGATGRDMVEWTQKPKLMPRVTFGKHKGEKWPEIPASYLSWIVGSDMDEDTKWNAVQEIKRRRDQ